MMLQAPNKQSNTLKVKFKKLHPYAIIPSYAKDGDGAMDLTCIEKCYENGNFVYKTGLAFEIPKGYVGLIFPRSSISNKTLSLTNSVGVIDSGYRGEITFKFKETSTPLEIYWPGDRIGQLLIIPYPTIELEEVNELSETERGSGGYGSSGT